MVRTVRVYSGATLLRILYPVAICMIFVAINVKLSIPLDAKTPRVIYGLFHSRGTDQDAANVVYCLAFVMITTTLGVIFYINKCYKIIHVYIFATNFALLLIYAFFHVERLAYACSLPISFPTAVFVVLQFGGLGLICIHWKGSNRLEQFYMIMLAALFALFILSKLPDWTVWIAIAAVSLWDILAVCTPCGPLKKLVETVHRRGDNHFPATLYSTSSFEDTPATLRSNWTEMSDLPPSWSAALQSDSQVQSLLTSPVIPRKSRQIREVEGKLRLGLGDFIFYSLMLGNTVQTSPLTTTLACFVANLAGLTITLPVVTLSQSAVPALPFPLAIAAVFYFSSHIALTPFTDLYTVQLLLV